MWEVTHTRYDPNTGKVRKGKTEKFNTESEAWWCEAQLWADAHVKTVNVRKVK